MMLSIFKKFRHKRSAKGLSGDRHRNSDSLFSNISIFFKHLLTRILIVGDRVTARVRGFTLLELLVAILISSVIISTLLAFTVNIMETDRREQAKVETQSDIQAALNYISNDLQEAVYIYNADSLAYNSTETSPAGVAPGIKDQLPQASDNVIFDSSNSTPVLVFWKRKYFAPEDDVTVSGATKKVGCLQYGTTTTNGSVSTPAPSATPAPSCLNGSGDALGSGRYVYSLVAYYLIYDNLAGTSPTWSSAARIGRWELSDGISSDCTNSDINTCPDPRPVARINVTSNNAPATTSSSVNYWTIPDQGFRPFATSGGLVDTLLNQWTKSKDGYSASNVPKILVDFIDDSPYSSDQDDGSSTTPSGKPPIKIAIKTNTQSATDPKKRLNNDCLDANIGVGSSASDATTTQRIPDTFTAGRPSSFYVCVNSQQNTARIYLRGNAYARLKPNLTESSRRIIDQTSTFLITDNLRAFGRGKVVTQ